MRSILKADAICLIVIFYFGGIGVLIDARHNKFDLARPPQIETVVVDALVNNTYANSVDSSIEYIYQYSVNTSRHNGDVRVHVKVINESLSGDFPVIFVVRQQQSVLSWQLPQRSKFGAQKTYYKASRTLCSEVQTQNNITEDDEETIFVTVSTASPILIEFSIVVTVELNFLLKMGEEYTASVSPPSPRFYRFLFPENTDEYSRYVLLEVSSANVNPCMTVSVQNSTCPIFDDESNVQFEGYWQTMSTKAGMTIRRDDFPLGFYVVFVAHTEDSRCTNSKLRPLTYFDDRKKELHFKIIEKISYMEYIIAIFGTIGIFVLFYVFSIVISCAYFWNNTEDLEFPIDDGFPTIPERQRYGHGVRGYQRAINTHSSENIPPESSIENEIQAHTSNNLAANSRARVNDGNVDEREEISTSTHWLVDSDSSLDETDIDLLEDANQHKDVFRTTTSLFLSSLARKSPRVLAKKSQMYVWTVLTVAVFYALPVVQLVFTYQKVLHSTGNQDLCYYNYLCSHPLWILSDFNHVYSNIGYIMLGLLFLILVYRKNRLYNTLLLKHQQSNIQSNFGIPCHFGLFYAIGASLIMEGVLSACYHVCPNSSNFQFDTSFMYVIALMCMLKIYQTRHPDINASAYMAFASLAFVILIGVLGVMVGNIYFWVVFTIFHVGVCFILSVQIYYLGRWRLDGGLFRRIYLTWKNDCLASPLTCLRPLYIDRMILLTLANLANWGIATFGIYNMNADFASHLLVIFMANLFIYTMFYILMKLTHRERIFWQSYIYIVLSVAFWGMSLAVFIHGSTSWQTTPAESRTLNRECLLLRFYDTHDIWHFLSAASMFFSFMILLTLDDGLINTPRHQIAVF